MRAVPVTASAIAPYPVQRQMFPFSARGRSAACSPVSAAAVMIIPGVQKPHWKPCAARNASCSGCGVRPSIEVTSRPTARIAGYTQLCTGTPSTCTVQAPQSPVSHPFFTPNQPCSRRNVRRHCPGRGSQPASWPLTRTVTGPPDQGRQLRRHRRHAQPRHRRAPGRGPTRVIEVGAAGDGGVQRGDRVVRAGGAANRSWTGCEVAAVIVTTVWPPGGHKPMTSTADRPRGDSETCRNAVRARSAAAGRKIARSSSPGVARWRRLL